MILRHSYWKMRRTSGLCLQRGPGVILAAKIFSNRLLLFTPSVVYNNTQSLLSHGKICSENITLKTSGSLIDFSSFLNLKYRGRRNISTRNGMGLLITAIFMRERLLSFNPLTLEIPRM